jgi:hypothetical protein
VSDTDIRAWALAQGEQVGARGTISADMRARYEAANGGSELLSALEPTDDDFPGDFSDAGPPPADREVRPRTVAVPKTPRFRLGRGKPAAGKAKGRKKARVPIDDTIATVWRFMGSLARPLPATSRLLKIQAPVAGKILEPIVKDTIVDRVLQPITRTTEGAEAVAVLLGTPALVTAMQLNPAIIPFAMPALRELMMRMVKIAGPAMTDALKQEREFEESYGGSVDDVIAMLFAGMFEGTEAPEDEDAAVRKAQEAMEAAGAAAA